MRTKSLAGLGMAGLCVAALVAIARPEGGAPGVKDPAAPNSPPAKPEQKPPAIAEILALVKPNDFEAALLRVAKDYRDWDRVSDHAHMSPTLCWAPPPEGAQRSESKDDSTHGKKLYHLYCSMPDEYSSVPFGQVDAYSREQPGNPTKAVFSAGCALVKESWTALEVPIDSVPKVPPSAADARETRREYPVNYLVEQGKAWKMGEQKDLFIMLRAPNGTEGTDEGWVYGTVTPDGSKVTSSGRVESCMHCHEDAKFERLFGPNWARREVQ